VAFAAVATSAATARAGRRNGRPGEAGVNAGPLTNGSFRVLAFPLRPRNMTGAAAAVLGKNASKSRAAALLRTQAMLHSRHCPCYS
jgi:hypothetical protein